MFARVSEFEGSPEDVRQSKRFTAADSERIQSIPGSRGMLYLIDPDSGRAMAVTFWDDEQALHASEQQANQVRTESTSAEKMTIVDVRRYEVAAYEMREASE